MRQLFFLLFFTCSLAFSQEKECDCAKFATGNFYTFGPDNNKHDTLYIIRTATEQTEIFGDDYNRTHHVIWLTPCKFILRDYHITTTKKYHKTDAIIEIVETANNDFIIKAWMPHRKKIFMTIYVLK